MLSEQTAPTPTAIARALTDRRERAQREALNYGLFRQVSGVYSVVSRKGGRVYETSTTGCTCPDFVNRGADLGACKHIYLVRTAEEEREETQRAQAARIAKARKMMEQDYPSDGW